MPMRRILFCAAAALAILAGGAAGWSKAIYDGSPALTADVKARQAGDALTIVINETTSTLQTKKAQVQKSAKGIFNYFNNVASSIFTPSLTASAQTDNNAKDASEQRFKATITAQVMKVEENGNLVVLGSRTFTINKDVQKLIVTGEVRPVDIAADNTIPSTKLMNPALTYSGPLEEKARTGLIQAILEAFF